MSFSTFKTTLLLFLALSSLIHAHDGITCNHDEAQEQNPPGHLDIQEDLSSLEPGRRLQSTTYPQLRIYANYDNLAKTASASYTSYIRDLLAPAVISYYESAIQVKYPVVGNLMISSSVRSLCSLSTPTDLINGVAADYAILYTSTSASNNILATSYNCQVASGTKRPIVASTTINSQMLRDPNGDVIVHEKNTYLLMHEMMHTLGFSKSLYKYFIDANGTTLTGHIKSVSIGGSTHTVIDVASLTNKLRTFHGCATMPGAIMGESGDDSHWDKKLYLYELMQSGAIDGKRVSEFGLSLLEASGWYVIDYDYAEPYFYGQGQGCSFINLGQCNSNNAPFDEFCATSGRGCNYIGNAGGTCSSGSNMDNCKYYIPSDSYHCENSAAVSNARLPTIESYGRDVGSKCFTGSLSSSSSSSSSSRSSSSSTSFCFQYNCTVDATGNNQLQVLLGANNTVVCAQEGPMSVSGYSGSLNCPDALTFCNTVGVRFCPRNCLGRGTCVNNQCQCNTGFTGVDCALNA